MASTTQLAFGGLQFANSLLGASGQEDFANAQADQARRRSLLDQRTRRRERRQKLARDSAASQASASARGIGVGRTTVARQQGLADNSLEEQRDDDRLFSLDRLAIETQRRRNLLALADQRRRAALSFGGTVAGLGPKAAEEIFE